MIREIQRALIVVIVATVVPASSAEDTSKWETAERCARADVAAPGKGYFEVRYKTRDGNAEAIEIRGCGANRAYRKVIKWGGDAGVVEAYAVPFFDKRHRDLLIMHGLDTDSTYYLFTAASNYEKVAVQFSAIDAPYFGDTDNDGRWEIRIQNIQSIGCEIDNKKWQGDTVKYGRADLTPDTLCALPPDDDDHL